MKRAVIYARYSSNLQSPLSNEDQVRLCVQHTERHAMTVVDRYEDAAISGAATENRPAFQQLMRAALSKPRAFDVILVEGLDRLTRGPGEAPKLHQRMKMHGIDIVGVTDGTDTSRKGAALQVAVSGIKNAVFLDDLSEKTHRGMAGRVARGLTAGGRCYGYHVVDGRREIFEAQAIIVIRIWREHAEGRSHRKIAHQRSEERRVGKECRL